MVENPISVSSFSNSGT